MLGLIIAGILSLVQEFSRVVVSSVNSRLSAERAHFIDNRTQLLAKHGRYTVT